MFAVAPRVADARGTVLDVGRAAFAANDVAKATPIPTSPTRDLGALADVPRAPLNMSRGLDFDVDDPRVLGVHSREFGQVRRRGVGVVAFFLFTRREQNQLRSNPT